MSSYKWQDLCRALMAQLYLLTFCNYRMIKNAISSPIDQLRLVSALLVWSDRADCGNLGLDTYNDRQTY